MNELKYNHKKELGLKLKAIREQKGLSAYKLALLGSIRPNQVVAIEEGEKNYTIDALLGYLRGCDLSISITENQTILKNQ